MKWFNYLLAALGIMMLGACDNKIDAPAVEGPNFSGDGYMTVKLGFVGAGGTRTMNFENGSQEESEIGNVWAYYFSSEGNTYLGAAQGEIQSQVGTASPGTNIERTADVKVPVSVVNSLSTGKKVYVVMVLNKPEDFAPTISPSSSTYSNFNVAYSPVASDNAGFMMTSVNYLTGSDNNIKENSLTEITSTNIAKEGSGVSPTPVTIYVERVCGKVKLSEKVGGFDTSNDATASIVSWGLSVKNRKVFPVKELKSGSYYPNWSNTIANPSDFDLPGSSAATGAGLTAVWNEVDKFRSYWAVDPNYDGSDNYLSTDFTLAKISGLKSTEGNTEYCLENTFASRGQNRDETTTAVILATYIPKELNDVEYGSAAGSTSTDPYNNGDATWVIYNTVYYTKMQFINQFLKDQKIFKDAQGSTLAAYTDVDLSVINSVSVGASTVVGGTYELSAKKGMTLYQLGDNGSYTQISDWTTINEALNLAQIYCNGYCYYEVPIRHFNDTEVPLDEDDINGVDQLGRYGIVRNHSYQLTVNSIKNPGKPIKDDDIEPDPDPDDDVNYYMDVNINVLSWAVRVQDIEL